MTLVPIVKNCCMFISRVRFRLLQFNDRYGGHSVVSLSFLLWSLHTRSLAHPHKAYANRFSHKPAKSFNGGDKSDHFDSSFSSLSCPPISSVLPFLHAKRRHPADAVGLWHEKGSTGAARVGGLTGGGLQRGEWNFWWAAGRARIHLPRNQVVWARWADYFLTEMFY